MATLGDLLKEARGDRSQESIADALECTQALISKWEAGKRTPPLGDVDRIAKEYGVSARRLRALIIERIESRGRRAS